MLYMVIWYNNWETGYVLKSESRAIDWEKKINVKTSEELLPKQINTYYLVTKFSGVLEPEPMSSFHSISI